MSIRQYIKKVKKALTESASKLEEIVKAGKDVSPDLDAKVSQLTDELKRKE